jgi:hypothetical protein
MTDLERVQSSLENRLLASRPASGERGHLWRELAQVHAAQGNRRDAVLSWVNGAWEAEAVPQDYLPGWPERGPYLQAEPLEGLAYWVWYAGQGRAAGVDLQTVRSHLFPAEAQLPVRLVWLGWQALVQADAGLLPEREAVYERLLTRLFHQGMQPEKELPRFSPSAGFQVAEDLPAFRGGHLLRCHRLARAWFERDRDWTFVDDDDHQTRQPYREPAQCTEWYFDLLFAVGLALGGTPDLGRELVDRAGAVLNALPTGSSASEGRRTPPLVWEAFAFRFNQAAAGQPLAGPLPPTWHASLQSERLERLDRYHLDRLRERLLLLEPEERVDPFQGWHDRHGGMDGLYRELGALTDLRERDQLLTHLRPLLDQPDRPPGTQVRILNAALDVSPRLPPSFFAELLDRVLRLVAGDPLPPAHHALLLRAGVAAVRFNLPDNVEPIITTLIRMAQEPLGAFHPLLVHAPRLTEGLARVGFADRVPPLLQTWEQARLAAPRDRKQERFERLRQEGFRLFLASVRGDLTNPVDPQGSGRPSLPDLPANAAALDYWRAYVRGLRGFPAAEAVARIEGLFTGDVPIRDTFTTCSHYALSKLIFVEAVVSILSAADFGLTPAGRVFLADEEAITRGRLHRESSSLNAPHPPA